MNDQRQRLKQPNSWTDEEYRILEKYYPTGGANTCKQLLPAYRSLEAIRQAANRKGIRLVDPFSHPGSRVAEESASTHMATVNLKGFGRGRSIRKTAVEQASHLNPYIGLPSFKWPTTTAGTGHVTRVVMHAAKEDPALSPDAKAFLESIGVVMNQLLMNMLKGLSNREIGPGVNG